MKEIHTVSSDDHDIRLDRWFKRNIPAVTHGLLQKFLRKGAIRVNGKKVESNERVSEFDVISIAVELPTDVPTKKEKVTQAAILDKKDIDAFESMICFEDSDILVINKPSGLAVQGGSKIKTSVDDLLKHRSEHTKSELKLVHRIDKDTSGLLVIAKGARSAAYLTKLFRDKQVDKNYIAIVKGIPELRQGVVNLALAKSQGNHEKMVPNKSGQVSKTIYDVLDKTGELISVLRLVPVTGRKHQLRAHMAAIGVPILGDGKYGGSHAYLKDVSRTLHLHAASIEFERENKTLVSLKAPLPKHMIGTMAYYGLVVD